ncbi:MAG: hypothetical protein EOP53_00510 [Sphingobacteriales bacterium]|nr:MAG: hypothetical protein EOP53_00510 [Sphingobacteriales bacterium]
MQVDAFCQTVAAALEKEHQFLLQINKEGIFSLPKITLQYLCGKAVFENRKAVFGSENVNLIWKADRAANTEKPVSFSYEKAAEKHYIFTDIILASQDDDLLVNLQNMLKSLQPHKKLAFVILKCTEKQVEVWQEKWQEKIGSILIPAAKPLAIKTGDENNIWLTVWQDAAPVETADIHTNVDLALGDAVKDMYFESMMLVMKRIVSLRTNLDEDIINAHTKISTIFKMVFAKEQGVGLEEVYDPEAMAGFTDSQLAASNFITDMQKAFNVDFNAQEIENIATVRDLVGIIIYKKSF